MNLDDLKQMENGPDNWQEIHRQLDAAKCDVCKGLGEVDDCEPGDIRYNKYACNSCDATGFKDGKVAALSYVEQN